MSTANRPASTGDPPAPGNRPPDVRRFWRTALAVIAPVPALATAASTVVAPYQPGESADIIAGAAADPGAMRMSVWLGLLTALTLIPAVGAVIWVCRRRAPRLTTVATALTIPGFSAGLSLPDDELNALIATQEGLDPATVRALGEGAWSQGPVIVALVFFLVGMIIGSILLGIALWRSRTAPRWAALALIVSGPLHLVGGEGLNAVSALTWVVTALGFAGASIALLRTSNDEFDLPPLAAPVQAERAAAATSTT